jgi:hypothetical protein
MMPSAGKSPAFPWRQLAIGISVTMLLMTSWLRTRGQDQDGYVTVLMGSRLVLIDSLHDVVHVTMLSRPDKGNYVGTSVAPDSDSFKAVTDLGDSDSYWSSDCIAPATHAPAFGFGWWTGPALRWPPAGAAAAITAIRRRYGERAHPSREGAVSLLVSNWRDAVAAGPSTGREMGSQS